MLDRIVATKRDEVSALRPRAADLRRAAGDALPPRPFRAALAAGAHMAVIAEVKRRSPSAGEIRAPTASATQTALVYEEAGASCISVLTDAQHFGGHLDDLRDVASAVNVPLLRKDFTIDEVQVYEARAAGASAILLIVRILDDAQLADYRQVAAGLGMAAIVEVHDEWEVERALNAGADIIGVNNRDLSTFHTDLGTTGRLAAHVPAGCVLIGESGVRDAADVARLADAGAHAVLVGEALMRASDPAALLASMAAVPRQDVTGQ